MLTERTVLDVSEKMFRHDSIMFYGPTQTFGLYKNTGGRVVSFTIPTEEARKPSGRKLIARQVYTDLTGNPKLYHVSQSEFLAGVKQLGAHPEIYVGNRTNRFRRIVGSIEEL